MGTVTVCAANILKRMDKLPALSPMVLRIAQELARRETDGRQLANLIEKDAVLCGQILKVANSAVYARRGQIGSVRLAVTFLGMNKMRRLALGFSFSNFFGRIRAASSWSGTRYNLHSLAVATLADMVAARTNITGVESAFICGLLHDIGKLAIAVTSPDEYDAISAHCSAHGTGPLEFERQILGIDHAALSGMVVAKWGLPQELQEGVAYHHEPEKRPRASGREHELHLCDIVCTANSAARTLGMVVEPISPVATGEAQVSLPGHELPGAEILRDFQDEWLRTCAVL